MVEVHSQPEQKLVRFYLKTSQVKWYIFPLSWEEDHGPKIMVEGQPRQKHEILSEK
jgi:hypothetical protein